jgi:hypothetical protein
MLSTIHPSMHLVIKIIIADRLSIKTNFPLHPHYADTGISPDMARLNFGGQRELLSHHESVGFPRKVVAEQQQPPTLFYTESDGGSGLDNIDLDVHTLHQFPDINGADYDLEPGRCVPYPDVPGAGPCSTIPVAHFPDSESAYAANTSYTSQGDNGPTSHVPFPVVASLFPLGYNIPCVPPGAMHTRPERHGEWRSFFRRLSTAPYPSGNVNNSPILARQLLSPPTTFGRLRQNGSPTQRHPPIVGQEIVKTEGASEAIRQAANRVRKKERKYECKECGDTLTSKQNLNSES